ncbi:RtcB family protein [Brachybacterium sp. p3-SID1565]|uniref:3'-phosphate/5'-hydroxy nucleic acid ligase n=1 Tax=Brachybacterium epidermidis TaxID=2781983 RepID=A0ABR9VZC3_9MICO|nr:MULTISPECIES: RtcB family protein [Brachybacterium]MBE9403537.1 RtcB family protein [Brachybacterium epidermidis]MCT1385352.1 RtcB family protein [Brachybacterium sp. p3-SID1565]
MTIQRITDELYNWASVLDEATLEQARTTAGMPFVPPHLASMPDAHLGKGATVGSVIPTDRAIIPAAVGVDIGCGMIAVRTQWTQEQVREAGALVGLRTGIEDRVPVSAGKYNRRLTARATRRVELLEARYHQLLEEYHATWVSSAPVIPGPDGHAENWRLQLGTLGSGNHFIEITVDEEDRVWAFLHSGSRGVGNRIAQHHIKVATQRCRREGIELPDRDLAHLAEGTAEFDHYIAELLWAQDFARENREEMMDRTLDALGEHMGAPAERFEEVNCHHNFTQREQHFGKELWISRKGAISARKGEMGLIPESMGTASYVVRGLGNPMAFHSSPHGAGRSYSRSRARRTFTLEQLREAMKGIEYRDTDVFIDEIPAAYKDIDQVMADAADLVEVVHRFAQIVNVKGD